MHLRLLLPVLIALGGCKAETAGNIVADNKALPAAATQGGSEESGLLDRSQAGKPGPATTFKDPDGEEASLADFRGKPVLVNLWATWCAPCVAEMPTLDALAAREQGRIEVLTLSQDLDGEDKVEAFFAKHKFKRIEAYTDPDGAFGSAVGVQSLPMTLLYDAAGREVWRVIGPEDWGGARAAGLLRQAGG